MIVVNSIDELRDRWINDWCQILGLPWFDEPSKKWHALANAGGVLAVIELSTTVLPHKPASEHP